MGTTMDVRRELGAAGARSLPADALERIRRQAVAAVESGIPQARVAQLFGVSRKSVGNWVRVYQARGEAALRPRRRGRRAGQRLALSAAQQAWVVSTVSAGPPDGMGLPSLLWTRKAVVELIRRKFGVLLSPATVDRYLGRWELLGKAEPLWQLSDCAPGTFLVAWTHPRSPTGSGRLNALVAVNNRGVLLFQAGEHPFTATHLAEFHRRLRVQLARDVRLLVRAWPAAHSALLGQWQM
jgi:transposase